MNSFVVSGNVGRDAEMRYTPNGAAVTNFSIAETRRYTSNGVKREETIWYDVAAWGKTAEFANQYVKKGMGLVITGEILAPRVWGDPAIAQNQIKAFKIEVARWPEDDEKTEALVNASVGAAFESNDPEDEIPF